MMPMRTRILVYAKIFIRVRFSEYKENNSDE